MSWKNNFSWKKNPIVAASNWVGAIAVIVGIIFMDLVTLAVGIALFLVAYLLKKSKSSSVEEVENPKKKKR